MTKLDHCHRAECAQLVTNLRQQIAHLNDDLAGVKSDVAYVTKQRDELIAAAKIILSALYALPEVKK